MNYEEMQSVIGQMLGIQRQIQENQLRHESEMIDLRAITQSNARAIEALGNKMSNLIEIVGDYSQATTTRLEILEDTER